MAITLIYPILNKSFISFKGPQWYLSDRIRVRNLIDEDYGAILKYEPKNIVRRLKNNTKCIYWECDDSLPSNEEIESKIAAIKYAINTFVESGAIHIPFCVILSKKRKTRVTEVIEFPYYDGVANSGMGTAKIKSSTVPVAISQIFALADGATVTNPKCVLMLKRFNMSLLRQDVLDQLVDIAIALEFLVEDANELTFRLSLIVTFCAEDDPRKRQKIFDLINKFYKARSRVVHGVADADDRSVASVLNSMAEIRKYGAVAMLYYFKFLENNNARDWRKHCIERTLNKQLSILT